MSIQSYACKRMSLFNSLKSLIQICQFSGLAPFSLNQNRGQWESNPSLKILTIIHLVFVGGTLLIGLIFSDSIIDFKAPKLRITLFIVLMLLNHLYALFVLFELFKKRNKQIKLLNFFEKLDILFKNRLNMHVDYSKLKIACHRFIIIWLCEISGVIIPDVIFYVQTKNSYTIAFFATFILPFILCKLSYAHSLMFVTLVRENLNVMNKFIRSINKQNGYYMRETSSNQTNYKHKKFGYVRRSKIVDLNSEMISFLKRVYGEIWHASKTIENLTYWSLPIGCTNDVIVLISNCYWFFMVLFIRGRNLMLYILLLILIFGSFVNMLLIAHNCDQTAESVSENFKNQNFVALQEAFHLLHI